MPLNATENYLRDRRDNMMINFSGAVTTSSKYLSGPGGSSGDGYPMTAPGKALRLFVWDGNSLRQSANETAVAAGDRLSLYATFDSPYFQVTLRVNGSDTMTYCTMVSANATLYASLLVRQDVY